MGFTQVQTGAIPRVERLHGGTTSRRAILGGNLCKLSPQMDLDINPDASTGRSVPEAKQDTCGYCSIASDRTRINMAAVEVACERRGQHARWLQLLTQSWMPSASSAAEAKSGRGPNSREIRGSSESRLVGLDVTLSGLSSDSKGQEPSLHARHSFAGRRLAFGVRRPRTRRWGYARALAADGDRLTAGLALEISSPGGQGRHGSGLRGRHLETDASQQFGALATRGFSRPALNRRRTGTRIRCRTGLRLRGTTRRRARHLLNTVRTKPLARSRRPRLRRRLAYRGPDKPPRR